MERARTLQYGGTQIPYHVVQRERRRTFSVILDPEKGVIVLRPGDATLEEVAAVVRKKAVWILRNESLLRAAEKVRRRRYVSGESFPYLGRYYQLEIRRASPDKERPVIMTRGRFVAVLPRDIGVAEKSIWIRGALQNWYLERARDRLVTIAEGWAEKIGVRPNRIYIRDQKKRWGSCDSRGNLRLNCRLVMAPISLIEYVVVHELCHLDVKDHSPAFWRRLASVMPDYESRRNRLISIGPVLMI